MSDLAQLVIRVDSLEAKVASRDLDKLTNAGTFAEKAMKVLAGTLAVMGLAAVAKESAMLAARFETMGVVMRTAGLNAGYAYAQMTAFENSLRKTGISMIESRNALTSLSTANIDLSKATGLARAAQDLAVVAGINSSEAFARMIHGIKSGEQEVLKTMGLNVQWEASYKKLAVAMGKSANDLTEQEKLQARLGVVMNASAGYAGIYEASMSTAGKQMASMTRYVEDLKVKFGAAFGPAIIAGVQAATEGLKGMSAWMDRLSASGQLKGIADTLGSITAAGIGAITGPMRLLVDHIEAVKNSLLAMGAAAAFAYGNQLIPQVAASIAPMARQLTMVVMLELETIKYATSMGIASGAAAVMRTALMALATPAAALAVGLAALYVATKGIREETERLNDATARQEMFKQNVQDPILAMRADAERLRKQREALEKDGGAPGAATRQNRIDELVKGATKNTDGSMKDGMNPAWIESAKLYARQIVDGKDALDAANKSLTDRATAETKAAAAGKEHAKVMAESKTATEALLLQRQLDAAWAPEESRRNTQEALELREINEAMDYGITRLKEIQKLKEQPAVDAARMAQEGAQLTNQMMTPGEKRNAELIRTEALLNGGAIGWETYSRRMIELEMQGSTMLQSLSHGLEGMGNDAADAFGRWASGMDGAALSFSKMARQMIADMARMAAQKGFSELLGFGMNALAGMSIGGGGGSTTYNPGSGSGVGMAIPKLASSGGGNAPVSSSIVVNITQSGAVDAKESGNMGAQAGAMLEGVVNQTIQKMMRPGGLLNQVGARS